MVRDSTSTPMETDMMGSGVRMKSMVREQSISTMAKYSQVYWNCAKLRSIRKQSQAGYRLPLCGATQEVLPECLRWR